MRRVASSILRSPHFLLLSFGVIYALLWHFSILYVSPYSWLDNRYQVERLFIFYLALHALLVLIVSIWAQKILFGGRWFGILLVAGYFIDLIVRALDWNVLYYYGGHVDVLFWDNAFYASSIGMLFTKVAHLSVLTVVAGSTIVLFLIRKIIRHQAVCVDAGMSLPAYLALYCVLPSLLVLLLGGVSIHMFFSSKGAGIVYTKYPPEYHFAMSIYDFLEQGYAEQVTLSDAQKSKLASMGLRLETASAEYPLLKNSVYLDESRELATYEEKPNVILVMAESFSSFFIEDPTMRELDITPNLNLFGEEAHYFSNIVNANTPTLQGQIATLASSLHLFKTTINMRLRGGHEDINEQNSDREESPATRYPYLSLLLKDHGYESVHIQSGNAGFAGTEHHFRLSAGYDDFISVSDSKYVDQREYKVNSWGASDIDTFRLASRWLETRQGGPFFMTISTMDIHHPYSPVVRKSGVEDNLLNTVFSTDAGFGVFWDYFRTSKYVDNTIIIFTADHPIFPTAEYLRVRGKSVGYYDKIPLIIYSPFHNSLKGTTDGIRGSQLDIAPTVFELLGLDSANAFMGLSLLSDRNDYPYLFGKVNLASRMQAGEEIPWSNEEQTELIKYIRYLASRNKLYPPPGR